MLQGYVAASELVGGGLVFMFGASIILFGAIYMNANIVAILFILFFYVFPLGVLLPATTELAITPFVNNSGMASALFGSIQLAVAFVCSILSGIMSNGTMEMVGIAFMLCSLVAVAVVFIKVEEKGSFVKVN